MRLRSNFLAPLVLFCLTVGLTDGCFAAPFWDWSMPPSLGRTYPGFSRAVAPVVVQPPVTQIPVQPPVVQLPPQSTYIPQPGFQQPNMVAPGCGTPTCASQVPTCTARPVVPHVSRQPVTGAVVAPQVVAPRVVAPQPVSVYRPFGSYYRRGYRSRWYRVPVTRYRPVVNYSPTTGIPVTTMQPCGSYAWQVRRVPTVNYRPVYATAPAGYVTPAQGPAVYYGATPTGPVLPQSPAVQMAPARSPTPAVPADNAPALSPGDVRGISSQQQAIPQRAGQMRSNVPGPSPRAKDDSPAVNSTHRNLKSDVTPIPDPDRQNPVESNQDDERIPQLLSPQNRTASHAARNWAISAIQWPEKSVTKSAEPTVDIEPVQWDDSGWTTIRQ